MDHIPEIVFKPVESPEDWEAAKAIRKEVFIYEQACPPEEEWDAYDVKFGKKGSPRLKWKGFRCCKTTGGEGMAGNWSSMCWMKSKRQDTRSLCCMLSLTWSHFTALSASSG